MFNYTVDQPVFLVHMKVTLHIFALFAKNEQRATKMLTTNKPAEEIATVSNACVLVGQVICCTSTAGTSHY